MRLASRVGTKKEISRKHIIQVGFTQLCGLGRFPEYPAGCKASGRHDARMCLMASRVVRERTRRTPWRLSLTPAHQCNFPDIITSRMTPGHWAFAHFSNGYILSVSVAHTEHK